MIKAFLDRFGISKKEIFLFLGIIMIIFSLPLLLTNSLFSIKDFTSTGSIGDTVGGITAPFLSVVGSVLVYIAFKEQVRANQLVQEQFRFQQFESQFYEMLKLHKENVNEIEINAKRREQIKVFPESGEVIASNEPLEKNFYEFKDFIVSKRNAFFEMQKEIEYMISILEKSDTPNLNEETFQKIYDIYFWGLNGYETLADQFFAVGSKKFEDMLYNIQKSQYSKDLFSFNENIPINIPAFKGHSDFLGHYYRHLFHTVKFIVNYDETLVSKQQKKNYLRLLRAQLSNHEQALLFYNWLSNYGRVWENYKNHFLTDYKMIHNLWHHDLPKNNFISNKLKKLITLYKSQGNEDDLFEMGDVIN